MSTNYTKKIKTHLKVSLIGLLLFCLSPFAECQNKIDPDNILIARDVWGTAHIFAATDAEVAYGLAWANAEDAFETIQEAILTAKGLMGRHKGKDGAAFDFFVHTIGAERQYEATKDSFSEAYLKYIDGYCKGINAFAKAFPERVLEKRCFPAQPKDIIKAFIISFSALSGAPGYVGDIVKGNYDPKEPALPLGSNAYALGRSKTVDGKTYLAINPHFMVDGPLSFYDVHLHSDEGLNMVGTLFQGGTSVFMGNNQHLGWGQTYNYVDQVDIFELKMHPRKKLFYQLDSQYYKLEKRPVKLKVKIGKKLVVGVKRMTYWSEYGPTLRSKGKKFYSLRSPAFLAARAGEQYYRMNKAKNFSEFKEALKMNQIPMFNIVYADKEDNLYYLCNSILPKRSSNFDYSQLLLGDTRANLWTEYYSLDEKPHVENPSCGYVFNMNNSPYNATCEGENFPKEKVDPYTDLRSGDNNRSTRFMEFMALDKKFSYKEFVSIKFDRKLSKNAPFYQSLEELRKIDPSKYPQIAEAIKWIQAWNGDANLDNEHAALFLVALQYIFRQKGYGDNVFILGVDIKEAEYIDGINYAVRFLNKHHSSIKIPLSKITCHERNGKLYCAAGFPDMMSPGYTEETNKGQLKMNYADTYIHFVVFDKGGVEKVESLLPFEKGKNSESYLDELEMFNKGELKSMPMEKIEVLKKAKKTYHPKLEIIEESPAND